MSTADVNYDNAFYEDLANTAGPSAAVIVPLVQTLVSAKRVVDVGCGDGSWLAGFAAHGAETIKGYDGKWLDTATLKIPEEAFERADLFTSVPTNERYDLAVSLEVAEHLPESRAEGFVRELTALAPVVLFSAAIPHQEGPNHINEQWPSYWAALFAQHAYVPVDAIRMQVWADARVTWWYKQNILIFLNQDHLSGHEALEAARRQFGGEARDLVHPDKYRALAKRARSRTPKWLKRLGF